MASASGTVDLGGSKTFSGEDEDHKEYKRWKTWMSNKLLTLSDKIPASARGAYVYTMLAGRALEAVEHLEVAEYQKEGGEKVLFELLGIRFPSKDSADELSENLTKIFELKATEGETLKNWISRASEAFERLRRKTSVNFPEEARGWIILNRAGLSAEQRAVELARSLGSLKREDIGKALRSCYPEFTVPKKKVFSAAAVNNDPSSHEDTLENEDDSEFADVEQFLADTAGADDGAADSYEESDVREILAATWQERRKSLSKLQKARRFHEAGQARRSFRVEVEELKKRTRCHRCQQIGHWSRECKNPASKGSGKGGSKSSTGPKMDSGAAVVEHFVASVGNGLTMLQRLRARLKADGADDVPEPGDHEQFLVSSPGFSVLDSGCGKTIVGEETLREFQQLWCSHGVDQPELQPEVNHFRFGNGPRETTTHVVSMPVILGGKRGSIRAAVVKGNAPLLISRSALRTLKAQIDFGASELKVFGEGKVIPLKTNAAGQYVVYLLGQSDVGEAVFPEIMQADTNSQPSTVELPEHAEPSPEGCVEPVACEHPIPEVHSPGPDPLSSWFRVDQGLTYVPITGKQSPLWHQIIRRKVINVDNNEVILDEEIDHNLPKRHYFVLRRKPQEKACPTECLPVHQICQVAAEIRKEHKYPGTYVKGRRLLVSEVFSPPRFSQIAESYGFAAWSYDLINGNDFRKSADRDRVKHELQAQPPDLLVLCPPCTNEGGWWNLNSSFLTLEEKMKKQRESRLYIRFCCELYTQQVQSGRHAIFEHPKGARTWSYSEVKALLGHVVKCHMCRYGLRLPDSCNLIRKSTNLLVSHEHMTSLGLGKCRSARTSWFHH